MGKSKRLKELRRAARIIAESSGIPVDKKALAKVIYKKAKVNVPKNGGNYE